MEESREGWRRVERRGVEESREEGSGGEKEGEQGRREGANCWGGGKEG